MLLGLPWFDVVRLSPLDNRQALQEITSEDNRNRLHRTITPWGKYNRRGSLLRNWCPKTSLPGSP